MKKLEKQKYREGALTKDEKSIVKKLLIEGWRGQDILALVNIGRTHTTNSGRITNVKQDAEQAPCSDQERDFYIIRQRSWNLKTGLNPYLHERLVRAREAMILAVQIFNSPSICFKAEVFTVLSNIAWTYLCHERLTQLRKKIATKEGRTLSLSEMWAKPELKLSPAIRANLSDIKELRDLSEHETLRRADHLWLGLFQASCLNFDSVITDWFGKELSLKEELSFSLQFSKADLEQLSTLNEFDVPEKIRAFNASLRAKHPLEILDNADYEFTVFYTLTGGSKSKSHIRFLSPETEEGKSISNVLIKLRPADDMYPFRAKAVAKEVQKLGKAKFSIYDHTQAVSRHKIRPPNGQPDEKKTNSRYCIYHKAHKDYTYSQEWINVLVSEIKDKKR